MIVDYVVFFLLLSSAFVFYALHKRRGNDGESFIDLEYIKTESPIERVMYKLLSNNGFHPRAQVPCGKYRIDLVVLGRIAIECDGKQWHSSPQQRAHDRKKDVFLRQNGYIVLRFSGRDIYRRQKYILKKIQDNIS
ncbi:MULTISPECIES: DUF559 domain-containing protein [Bacillus cereus group]|uniref:DUF559 domain-containing protein n=1 Tax=Bacillus cereus group TaxID=86661 RepID=UPI00053941D3